MNKLLSQPQKFSQAKNGFSPWIDKLEKRLGLHTLKRNRTPLTPAMLPSLGLLFIPGVLFLVLLLVLPRLGSHWGIELAWLYNPGRYPWQLWAITGLGIIASVGGVGDWLFHRIYVTVGPREHHSHLLALGAGVGVFVLMAIASLVTQPAWLLIPIIMALIVTVTLICYDEFAFHIHRCTGFETLLHRLLVFGNGLAFLCWFHWIFVAGGFYG